MCRVRCSVAMASYNGELYIGRQIESILRQLADNDELIISDDGSTDQTRQIIDNYQINDNRIRVIDGPQNGVIANFENAIMHATGEYIFLCDQDDVWEQNKIEKVLDCFSKQDCQVVVHDADVWDENEDVIIPSFINYRGSKSGVINNIIKNSYIGCCMVFRRELLEYILPIPKNIEMHDQWIGVIGDIKGKTFFLNEVLFHYRRHGGNVSSFQHYSARKMLINRLIFCWEIIKCCILKRNR